MTGGGRDSEPYPGSRRCLEPGFCDGDKLLCPSPPPWRGPRVPGGKSTEQGRAGFRAGAEGATTPQPTWDDGGRACSVSPISGPALWTLAAPSLSEPPFLPRYATPAASARLSPEGALTAQGATRTPLP